LSRASRKRSQRSIDFAVLTPTAMEYDSMCAELTDGRSADDPSWPAMLGTIGPHRVAVFLSGKGQEPTAATMTLVAERYRPRWALLVGIAGGTRKLHRGDLIVANFVYSVDYGKLVEREFLRRPELDWSADPALSSRGSLLAEGVERPWISEIHVERPDGKPASVSKSVIGYVGSSDKVVDDLAYPMIVDGLRNATEIDVFEMEAAGAGIGARARNVGLLMIRGISDEPHHEGSNPGAGSDQRALWKRYASHIASVFARHLISSMPPRRRSAAGRKAARAESGEQSEKGDPHVLTRTLVQLQISTPIVPRDCYREAVRLIREGGSRVVLVRGLPDCGKTSALAFVVTELHGQFEHLMTFKCDRRAAIEPGYVLERLNGFLATLDLALPAEMLRFQSPELSRDQMLACIVDLDCLVVLDDAQYLPEGWAEKLLLALSLGPRVRVIASTDRGLPGVTADVITIPPLDDAEAGALISDFPQARVLSHSPAEMLARLQPAVRSNPAALRAVVAQLGDIELAVWPVSSAAVDEPQRAIEDILAALPSDARESLGVLLPLSGIRFGAVIEIDGIRERLLQCLLLLLERALVARGQGVYVVPTIVAAAFRNRYAEIADAAADFVIARCMEEFQELDGGRARTLAVGEILGAVASHCAELGRWSACARLASDEMLLTLHGVGLWKEYTLVLQAGIRAAEALAGKDRVRLACQLSRKLFEMRHRAEAQAVLDRLGPVEPGTEDEARLISHRALFRPRFEDQIADLRHSIELHETHGRTEEAAIGWKIIGNLHFGRNERDAARTSYNEAMKRFDERAGRHAIDIAERLARCDYQDDLLDQADARATQALKDCEPLHYYAGRRPLLMTLAFIAEKRDDDARALELAREASAEPFGDPFLAVLARSMVDRISRRQEGAR
jgi:nucleoside phosphorylase